MGLVTVRLSNAEEILMSGEASDLEGIVIEVRSASSQDFMIPMAESVAVQSAITSAVKVKHPR